MERMDVICFGGEDWWYHNRGHIDMQLMRRFARLGTALYVNSVIMQKIGIGSGTRFAHKLIRKTKSILAGLKRSDAGFWVYSPLSLPVQHIGWLKPVNELMLCKQLSFVTRKLQMRDPLVWVACPAACDVAIDTRKVKLVYQRTDRFEEYPNVDIGVIRKHDQRLKARADLTVFVDRALYEEEASCCNAAMYLDHGVDYGLFAGLQNNKEIPADIEGIKRPIVGFFGGIDGHTSDIALLEKTTELLPEMSFVFIGKASVDCNGLLCKENVWMLGQKPYEQIPHYGECFDVAIMPWKQNRWIEACNPIKLKEYLALGKPVVSTPFAELNKYLDVVYVAKNPGDFAECIRKALAEDGPERVAARRKKVEKASWDSKAEQVLGLLFDNKKSNQGEPVNV